MLSSKSLNYLKYKNLSTNVRLFNSKIFKSIQNPTFIAIPDVPNVNNNPHNLQDFRRFPDFSKLPPDQVFMSMSKALQLQETQMTEFCDIKNRTTSMSALKDLENVIVPAESAFKTADISSKIHYSRNSYIVMNSLATKFNGSKRDRWTNEVLYKLVTDLHKKSSSKNTPQEYALLNMYLRHFHANGMKMSHSKRDDLHMDGNELHEKQNSLVKRTVISGSYIKQMIRESDLSANTPSWFKDKVSLGQMYGNEKTAVMSADDGPMILRYCQIRPVREKMWKQLNDRDAFESNVARNSIILSDIRRIQRNFAQDLGYESYAEFALNGQMAGNVEKIMAMIEGYKKLHYEKSLKEADALNIWAKETFNIEDRIRGWDSDFVLQKKKEESTSSATYNVAPLSQVLQNIFSACEDLFSLKIERCSPNSMDGDHFFEGFSMTMLPSESCDIYRVRDGDKSGQLLGYFVCDLHSRDKKENSMRNVMPLRCRSSASGLVPVFYWMDSLSSIGSHSANVLISFGEIYRIIYSVGRILESICTSSEYWALSDPVEQPSDFHGVTGLMLQKLVMSCDSFYHRISGAKLPDKNLLTNPVSHIEIMNELYSAAIDLELAVSEDFWFDIQKKLSADLLPIQLEKNDISMSYNTDLFGPGSQPARRYSALWMNMLAEDLITPFHKAGISTWNKDDPLPPKVKDVSMKYRNTFLSQMGITPPTEIFRLFRGRDHVRSPADISRRK